MVLGTRFQQTSNGAYQLHLRLKNIGEKPIAGYVLVFESSARTKGTNIVHSTLVGASGLGPSYRSKGEEWDEEGFRFRPKDRQPPQPPPPPEVDYILFIDGSKWGPNNKHQSHRLKGMQEGIRAERWRLQRLLKEQGINKVADYITANAARPNLPDAADTNAKQLEH